MRIRKLAQVLEREPAAILGLLQELGQTRYSDAEQQLPAAVEALVRRHARRLTPVAASSLSRGAPDPRLSRGATGPPDPRPRLLPPPSSDPELAMLRQQFAGVRRLGEAVPRVTPRPVPVEAPVRLEPPRVEPMRAEPLRAEPVRADAVAILAERLRASEHRAATLEMERDALRHERDALAATLERQATESPNGLRAVFERRGLRGEDECALAMRRLLEARRDRELLPLLSAADAAALEDFLWTRLALVAEGDEAPPGVVAVQVPPDRSEGLGSAAVRGALVRFASACLVTGRRRVLLIGGSPVHHRALREGIDARVDLRAVPWSPRLPDAADAELVLLWAPPDPAIAGRYPGCVVLPRRGVGAMLADATEAVEPVRRGPPPPG